MYGKAAKCLEIVLTTNNLEWYIWRAFSDNIVNKTQEINFVLEKVDCWLVGLLVLVFNATLTAKVISWRLVTHMCFLAFPHQY